MNRIGEPVIGLGGAELPLSSAIEAYGFVFVSGQLAIADGRISGADVAAQTDVILNRIAAILAEAGLGFPNIVKTSVWLTAASDFDAFNNAYAKHFTPPYPARSTVISALAIPGALVEIDAVAER